MSEQFAAVHILDAPYHADRAYTYYVPAELRGQIAVGMLVTVPYGASNRKASAVVTGLSAECDLEQVKPVSSVSSAGVVLNEEMRALCDFMKEHTLCTIGEAVRAVVPAAAFSRLTEYYSITPREDADAKLARLGDKAAFFYAFIAARERVSLSRLRTEFGGECASLTASLLRAGLIVRDTELRESKNERCLRLYSLSAEMTDEEARGAAMRRLRSPVQSGILSVLAGSGEMREEDLRAAAGAGSAQISALVKKGLIVERKEDVFRNPFADRAAAPRDVGESPLSEEQAAAYDTICRLYDSGEAKAALLHGVTGSGKTRVILAAIDRALADRRGAILLVPEIALTPQTVGIFLAHYGERVAVIHSSLSAGERYDAWRRIREGAADVVIGTRSAVFAPLPRLGVIIIDEEQEHTYKSDASPKYSAHDIARFRCARHRALMLLSSATPSVTSYYKAVSGIYTLIEMRRRYGRAVLPHVVITDMRGEPGGGALSPLGSVLRERLTENLREGKQSILFLNRRGYHNFVTCRTCGEVLQCPSCSVSLTYHTFRALGESADGEEQPNRKAENGLLCCHYCGYRIRVPDVCPQCGGAHLLFHGYGTQRVEDELAALSPAPRVIRMDMDTTQTKFAHEELLGRFRRGEADVLLGTQMVAKGHDFPDVTLVGVINADSALYLDDYRAAERTFAMLTQVIGRAGRADAPGTAVVQTMHPTSDVLTLAANQDYKSFYQREIRLREALVFPPFCDIAVVTLASRDEALLASAAVRLREWVRDAVSGAYSDVKMIVFGPFDAPIYRVQGVCRSRLVIKCRLNRRSRAFLSALLTEFGRGAGRRLTVSADLNPNTL